VYTLGQTDDNKKLPVMITVTIIGNTDIIDLQRKPEHFKLPFFQKFFINCGQFKSITSLDEDTHYDSATIFVNDDSDSDKMSEIKIAKGKFFNIDNYDYDAKIGLLVYPYKNCVLNTVQNFAGDNYSGVIIKYYEGGNIYKRLNYQNGDLDNEKIYKNNEYNTLWAIIKYKKGTLMHIYHYDEKEQYLGEAYYNSKGDIHHHVERIPDTILLELSELNTEAKILHQLPELEVMGANIVSSESIEESEELDDSNDGGAGGAHSSEVRDGCRIKINNDKEQSESSNSSTGSDTETN
jgi:hypothetical protein